jgi:hypothetical protein
MQDDERYIPRDFAEQREILLDLANKQAEINKRLAKGTADDSDIRLWTLIKHWRKIATDPAYAQTCLEINKLNEEKCKKL